MKVIVENDQKALKISKKQITAIAKEIVAFEGQQCDEVSLHFVDTPTICQLHDEYFDDPTTTDCISFPMDGPDAIGYRMLGDVFVCPETAIEYAKTHQTDPLRETILYVIHGLLHLMGYDDIEENDIIKMRAAENKHLDNLTTKKLML